MTLGRRASRAVIFRRPARAVFASRAARLAAALVVCAASALLALSAAAQGTAQEDAQEKTRDNAPVSAQRSAPESAQDTAGASAHDPETGYRIAHYRAAVPPEVPGGTRIWLDDIDRLVKDDDAVLLDVMPATGFGYDPRTGRWRLSKIHDNIPGSVWLPDVGRGRISAELDRYFRENLERLTGGDTSRALIVYCQSDCWMGWNAVQRAAGYGYRKIYWYPEGIDGWRDWEREFDKAVPVPVDVSKARVKSQLKSP